jgi:ComF family protein
MTALADRLADWLWPPACPLSGAAVDKAGRIAPAAWRDLAFLDAPWCVQCGRPFPYDAFAGGPGHCGPCIARPPVWDAARAPLAYDEASKGLVLAFKHGGRTEMLGQFARWMAAAGRELLPRSDLVLPVPLHWRRRVKRRFNQSALLGRALAEEAGLAFSADSLVRVKATPSQAGQTAKGRWRNMRAAFRAPPEAQGDLAGKRVVLVDDVLTTGATVTACVKALRRAGAERVYVMTLCRVVRTEDPTK